MDKNIIKSVWRHKDIKVVFSEPSMRNRGYGYWGDEWFSDNKSKKEHV